MKWRKDDARKSNVLRDRLVWQAASLLLAYPDDGHRARLDSVDTLIGHLGDPDASPLRAALSGLRGLDALTAQTEYVQTFDLSRRRTMLLTYWTAGDTRNRGMQMLTFARAYRAAGAQPPTGEAPDHLPVVLEFAATVDPAAGRALLTEHRVPLEALRQALAESGSPYAHVVAAVCATLPVTSQDQVRRLISAGPPAEAVGLQPFQLTVPPRRAAGGG
ncbi:nitrate reductase molybdenum cofactor assembly chaperone [Mycobacterium frederiksbergense]|uniref:nitrate reductase molybdenum cofactor assembly chaperone n=1 Tax=Mycolicibacterium frederiksbergense TaxID=117567 RepID=UPI001AE3DF0D|nr:nitrate reductase molybdenum cofactor assembly chaperone [Mycolicibacterium frederiksbergense]MCV7046597.1 nitrate reductase molybdenum cofactor assembly chaperone [Mycolicibacterium frederiksbergense]